MSRIERGLVRLSRALVRAGGAHPRAWALRRADTPLDWPADLPALPEDLRQLLQWRSSADPERADLYLPTLDLFSWQQCAEEAPFQYLPIGPGLSLRPDGVFQGDRAVADSLAELVELEALICERLPGSPARTVRIELAGEPWSPCPRPDPATLASCEPGTVFCERRGEHTTFSILLGPHRWATTHGRPEHVALNVRLEAYLGALTASPSLGDGRYERSALRVWSRPPRAELIARLEAALALQSPFVHQQLRPPRPLFDADLPAALLELWAWSGGSGGQLLLQDQRLLGPAEASEARALVPEGLVPFLSGEADLTCLDPAGLLGPPGAVVLCGQLWSACTVLHESLDDWLETRVLELERGEDDMETLTSPGCPRDLSPDWAEQADLRPLPDEEDPLALVLELLPDARELLELAWQDAQHVDVLRDWLLDRGAPVGRAMLATLVSRAVPLLA